MALLHDGAGRMFPSLSELSRAVVEELRHMASKMQEQAKLKEALEMKVRQV
jgi:hypothetical protein